MSCSETSCDKQAFVLPSAHSFSQRMEGFLMKQRRYLTRERCILLSFFDNEVKDMRAWYLVHDWSARSEARVDSTEDRMNGRMVGCEGLKLEGSRRM